MTACFYGNMRMIELLIGVANANLDLVDVNSSTAWQLALENSYNDCAQLILNELETSQMRVRQHLEKELHEAVFNNDYEHVCRCLKRIPLDNLRRMVNSTTSGNHTLLYRACRNGNVRIVQLLVEHGAIAKPHYYTKYSPLYIACHLGNLPIARLILKVHNATQTTTTNKNTTNSRLLFLSRFGLHFSVCVCVCVCGVAKSTFRT